MTSDHFRDLTEMMDNLVEIDHFNRVDFDAFTQARGNPGGKEITMDDYISREAAQKWI